MKNPLLRYYGGKFNLAPWIISKFPAHYTYVEPYGGGAAVLLSKQPSRFEVYNDLDKAVTTFFRVLREREHELIRAIELTPWSREEQRLSLEPCNNELEQARRFYVRSWQCFSLGSAGWRYQHSPNGYSVVEHWNNTTSLKLSAERLKYAQIENKPALEVIQRFDTPHTLFYVDPPYVSSERFSAKEYVYEMSDTEHEALLEVLNNDSGKVLISGYDNELYNDCLPNWRKVTKTAKTNGGNRTEVLWISAQAKQTLPLFAGATA